ncbi:hypothetical protein [Vibrio sp. TRT 29B02]|uniref:hypothetical protein n=1 Tax=Vibrio sp. TRT 29B02 TaxID=3418508 RepID=UPI003CF5BC89
MEIVLRVRADAEQLIYNSELADRDEDWLLENVRIKIDCDSLKTDFLPVSAIDNCHGSGIEDSLNGIWLLTPEREYGFCVRPNGEIYDYVADREGKSCLFYLNS